MRRRVINGSVEIGLSVLQVAVRSDRADPFYKRSEIKRAKHTNLCTSYHTFVESAAQVLSSNHEVINGSSFSKDRTRRYGLIKIYPYNNA